MFTTLLAAAWLLAQAAPDATHPAEPAPAATPATTAAKPAEDDPVICRYATPLGSRLPQKTCERRSVLERKRLESRRMTEDLQTRSRGPFLSPK